MFLPNVQGGSKTALFFFVCNFSVLQHRKVLHNIKLFSSLPGVIRVFCTPTFQYYLQKISETVALILLLNSQDFGPPCTYIRLYFVIIYMNRIERSCCQMELNTVALCGDFVANI